MRQLNLLTLIAPIAMPMLVGVGSASAEVTPERKDEINTVLQTTCSPNSTAYDQAACDAWYLALTADEQAYVQSVLTGDDFPVEAAEVETWYTAPVVRYTSGGSAVWQFTYTIRKRSQGITNWAWNISQEWCSKYANTISGCMRSWTTTGGYYSYTSIMAVRTTASDNSWTRLERQAQFTLTVIVGYTCSPVFKSVAYPAPASYSTADILVELAEKRCP